MVINIYYGGRGLIEDPTLYVLHKLTEVLEELRVTVNRYNLYEDKNGITTLPKTLKGADGVILATAVEWLGIGGLMQEFLDACWLYGDKEQISKTYMLPVVIASTSGEKEAELTLVKAWEILGGIPCEGISAYISDHVEFETNEDYAVLIEKKAEQLYRVINQKSKVFPTSTNAIKKNVLRANTLDLTPQESEQLSEYVSDTTYVKKQKEDIEELTRMFQGLLDGEKKVEQDTYIEGIKNSFQPRSDFQGSYSIQLTDKNKSIVIDIHGEQILCYYGDNAEVDVIAKTTDDVFNKIVTGRMTFQRAFMSGELTAKGNFEILRTFDQLFQFSI